ncbi:MAG: hypothetical protein HOW97_18945 [Catenulispora sp.]|nr:hypothetical protein [Catenulispora sp.]
MTNRVVRKRVALSALAAVLGGVPSAAAQHANAAAARQNGRIGFIDSVNGGWVTANPDGSDRQVVSVTGSGLPAGAQPLSLKYSPDGTKAVVGFGGLTGNYWLVDAAGHVIRQLPDALGGLGVLSWSPDGTKLYASSPLGTHDPQSTAPPLPNRVVVLDLSRAGAGWTELPGQPAGCDDSQPTAAPDGRVVFVVDCPTSPTSVTRSLYELDPGTATARRLPIGGTDPQFSPDGGRLSVVVGQAGATGYGVAILTMPLSQSEASWLPPVVANVGGLEGDDDVTAWSPDGSRLLVRSTRPGSGADYAMDYSIHVVDARPGGADHVVAEENVVPSRGLFSPSWQSSGAAAPGTRVVDRIGGADRVDTAIAASQWSYDTAGTGGRQANVAVLSRADQFADALAGNALAAQKRGPLLLTGKTGLDPRVAAELKRTLAPNATVYVLGGTAALDPSIDEAVRKLGFHARRLAGQTRFGTAVEIAKEITPDGPHTVMVATGADFPDALAAGPAAAQDLAGGVVVLSDGAALPPETRAYLDAIDPHKTDVYAVGGQGVAALASGMPGWHGAVTPLAGSDRYATATAVAHSKLFGLDGPIPMAGVATGATWPDALSGGALLGVQHGPLLLTAPTGLTADEVGLLTSSHLTGLAVFGGKVAVPESDVAQAGDAAFGAGKWSEVVDRKAPALPAASLF